MVCTTIEWGCSPGSCDEMLVIGNDITDLKRSKRPLEARQSLYTLLNKVMPTLINLGQVDPTDLKTHQELSTAVQL